MWGKHRMCTHLCVLCCVCVCVHVCEWVCHTCVCGMWVRVCSLTSMLLLSICRHCFIVLHNVSTCTSACTVTYTHLFQLIPFLAFPCPVAHTHTHMHTHTTHTHTCTHTPHTPHTHAHTHHTHTTHTHTQTQHTHTYTHTSHSYENCRPPPPMDNPVLPPPFVVRAILLFGRSHSMPVYRGDVTVRQLEGTGNVLGKNYMYSTRRATADKSHQPWFGCRS